MEASEGGVQPEGQGADEGGDSGFYQEYLQNEVPEDYRAHVEPYLRNIESNANEKFREHAEYRKQWEPYENLNLNEIDPDVIQNLLSFAELANSEDTSEFNNWWQEVGRQKGFFDSLEGDDEEDDYDTFGNENGEGELTPESLKQLFESVLDERLTPLEQRTQQEEQMRQQNDAVSSLEKQMTQMAEEHGLSEAAQQRIYQLSYAYADDSEDPLAMGLKDYMDMRADIEGHTVTGKLGQPAPPEPGGGRPDTSQKVPTTFAEADDMAREKLAALKRQ